jgi:hypothetical protein
MTLWVRSKPAKGLTDLKMAELQLTITNILVKVKFALEQVMKAQMGSRDLALLLL